MYEKYCRLRDAKGVKDAEVSRGSGVARSTFSDWKSGRSQPKKDKLQKIADYFNVPVEYFFYGDHVLTNTAEVAEYISDLDLLRELLEHLETFRGRDISDAQLDRILEYAEFITKRK